MQSLDEYIRALAKTKISRLSSDSEMEIHFLMKIMKDYPHESIAWKKHNEIYYSQLYASLIIYYCKNELIRRKFRGIAQCKTET